ncbi:MAG: anti-sigma factor [Saprospiraceae bacterium]
MDTKAYIESGILEQYVIGSLSAAEIAEVEKNIKLYPEIANEVASIENALEAFAQSAGKTPKLTEDQLIKNLANQPHTALKSDPDAIGQRNYGYVSWLLALALAGLAAYFFSRNNTMRSQNNQLTLSLDSIRNECDQTSNQNQILLEKINHLNDADSKYIRLAGTKLSPSSFASVIIDSSSQKLYFDFAGLPKPPSGKQFQLWVIKDGKPVDMGVVSNNDIGVIRIIEKEYVDHAQAFALTLEDEGGKPSPTLEQMYVVASL